MRQTDMNVFMQSLRGNQPLIVLAFLLVRSALTIEQLEAMTGLHNDTVRGAVKGLASKGLLYSQRGEHGRATWLPAGDTFFGSLFAQSVENLDPELQSPKTSDSGVNVVVVVESEESEKFRSTITTNSPQSPKTSDSGLSGDELLNLAALKVAGIVGKKARQLAVLPWVTVEYIEAHVEQVKHEFWDNPQGMVIHRIQEEMPVEEVAARKDKFHVMTIDNGKRGSQTMSYTWDIDQEIADFIGHEKGCRCSKCRYMLAVGMDKRMVCPDCKCHECECDESEEL